MLKPTGFESNNLAMLFHDKLKLAMKTNGLDREDLIARVATHGQDLTRSTLSNYLKGDTRPSMMMGLALARVLGVPLDYLADDELDEFAGKAPGELTPDERAALSHFRVQRRTEGKSFTPEELAWRIAVPRTVPGPALDGKTGQPK